MKFFSLNSPFSGFLNSVLLPINLFILCAVAFGLWQTDFSHVLLVCFFTFFFCEAGRFASYSIIFRDEIKTRGEFSLVDFIGKIAVFVLGAISYLLAFSLLAVISIHISLLVLLHLLFTFTSHKSRQSPVIYVLSFSVSAYFIYGLILLLVLEFHLPTLNLFPAITLSAFLLFMGIKEAFTGRLYQLRDGQLLQVSKREEQEKLLISCIKWFITISFVALVLFLIALFQYFQHWFLIAFVSSVVLLSIAYYILTMVGDDKERMFQIPDRPYIIVSSFFLIYLCLLSELYIAILFLLHPYFLYFLYRAGLHAAYTAYILFIKTLSGIRHVLSLSVNYTLYYLFLIFGRNLKEKPLYEKMQKKNEEPAVKEFVCAEVKERKVHGMWIGNKLTNLELLTIHSFIANGYDFHLWLYDELENELPPGCIVCDATKIIPREDVFSYKHNTQFGIGKGSVAGFSDIFRYKLLHDIGGWWVDMDVTCLKPFDVESDYFFRAHHDLPLVGNVMKAPKASQMMWACYEEAKSEINEHNRDWHKPIDILINHVYKFGLEKFVYEGMGNTDEWHKVKPFLFYDRPFPKTWHIIHWCNEAWRSDNIQKKEIKYNSTLGKLLDNYGLLPHLSDKEIKKHDRLIGLKQKARILLEWI